MITDAIQNVLSGAKNTLERAHSITQSPVGNPVEAFVPRQIQAPKIPQAHQFTNAPYSIVKGIK
jgi:hypothetical protein